MSEPMATKDTQDDSEVTSWMIRKLADGKFVLGEGPNEYGYDNAEDLLADLKDDLGGNDMNVQDNSDQQTKMDNVKKAIGGDQNEG